MNKEELVTDTTLQDPADFADQAELESMWNELIVKYNIDTNESPEFLAKLTK